MACNVKNPITSLKYVEYIAEDRNDTGCWGVLPTNPTFVWLGLVTEFIHPRKELYEECGYSGAHDETHTLELQRNTNVGTELTASLKYVMQNWDFMEFITGSSTGFSDTVDSISVVAFVDGKWTVLTGGMLTKWALTIPKKGICTVDADLLFGEVDSLTSSDPKGVSGSHATELSTAPFLWGGITELYMDATDTPSTSFLDIVGDIGLTITNDVEMSKGVDSTYTTKGIGVTVKKRKLEVSLDLTYTSPNLATFQGLVANHTKQNMIFTLGGKTITVKGLLFNEWVAELKPAELVGQTVTAITDLPYLTMLDVGAPIEGASNFAGPTGVVITHNGNLSNYIAFITSTADPDAAVGEIYISPFGLDSFTVYNSGTGLSGFRWLIPNEPYTKGNSTFAGPAGQTIAHTEGDTNYIPCVVPSANGNGAIGECWITDIANTSFDVHNSGSGLTAFKWGVLEFGTGDNGVSSFAGDGGRTITHNLGISGDYTPLIVPTANPNGQLGAVYVTDITTNSFVVRNTGSAITAFTWLIGNSTV